MLFVPCRRRASLVLLGVLGLAAAVPAQNCPDHGLEDVPVKLLYQGWRDCDAGLQSVEVGDIVLSSNARRCPIAVVVEPARSVPTSDDGSGMRAAPVAQVDVVTVFYRCRAHWVLGLIPITISESCVIEREVVSGVRDHYGLSPCPDPGEGGR